MRFFNIENWKPFYLNIRKLILKIKVYFNVSLSKKTLTLCFNIKIN